MSLHSLPSLQQVLINLTAYWLVMIGLIFASIQVGAWLQWVTFFMFFGLLVITIVLVRAVWKGGGI